MHELLPKAKRMAVLVNPANAKTADATAQALRAAASSLGLELLFFKASTAAEIDGGVCCDLSSMRRPMPYS